jgi:hypothetical protein
MSLILFVPELANWMVCQGDYLHDDINIRFIAYGANPLVVAHYFFVDADVHCISVPTLA